MTMDVAVGIGLLVQTATIAWWASRIDTLVRQHDEDLKVLAAAAADPEKSAAGRSVLEAFDRLSARVDHLSDILIERAR